MEKHVKQPKVGDIVHYYPLNPAKDPDQAEPRAAIVTKVPKNLKHALNEPWIGLCVLNANGNSYGLYGFSEEPREGYWTWMT